MLSESSFATTVATPFALQLFGGGSTVNVGGSGVNVGGSAVTAGYSSVNVGGSVVNVGGSAVNVGGSGVNVGSSAVNVGGSSVNVGGSGVNVGGSAVNVGGSSVNVGGSGVNVGGSGVNVGSSGVNVGGSSLNVGGSGVNVGGSGVNALVPVRRVAYLTCDTAGQRRVRESLRIWYDAASRWRIATSLASRAAAALRRQRLNTGVGALLRKVNAGRLFLRAAGIQRRQTMLRALRRVRHRGRW